MIALDRLAFIIQRIEEWKERDPGLSDCNGFIRDLKQTSYRDYPINSIRVWIHYFNEAKKMRLTIPELIFLKASRSRLNDRNSETKREVVTVEVVPEQKYEELKQITLRLKQDDPLRKRE